MAATPPHESPAPGTHGAPPPRLRLLGQPAWSADGVRWQPLSRKDAVLLAMLLLHGPQPRAATAARLWPDVPLPRANANLRQRLFRLRQQQARLVLEQDQALALAGGVQCDLGDDAADGTLLAALVDERDGLQPWIDEARRHWDAGAAARLAALAGRLEAAGELDAAIGAAERWVAQEPLHEHGWRRLMQLHLQRRDRAAALAAFERCERVLRDELGVRPSPATLALLHRVETLQPGSAPGATTPLDRPAPLVGRAAEREAMAAAWQAGRTFVLIGEAGLGKTRLLGAFAASQPDVVLESARPGDGPVAYGLVVRLLRALARRSAQPERLWPDDALRAELARLLPELGTPPAAPGLQALLHDAVEQALRRAATHGLQGVLLDDLQHADDASLALLLPLALQGNDAPLRWGLASRPDARLEALQPASGSARAVVRRLAALPAAELAQLLRRVAPATLDLARHGPALVSHSGGNPLFLLETLRHWLHQDPAATAPPPWPPSVQALVAERLARLPAAARELAQVAAIAGADFDATLACDVLTTPALALAPAWQALHDAQLLHGERFVHDTVQEAVRSTLPAPLTAPLHASVARALQARGARAARLLHHWRAAGRPAETAQAARATADEALRLGRLGERAARLDEAAAAFEAAGEPGLAYRARVDAAGAALAADGPQAAATRLAALQGQAPDAGGELAWALQRAAMALQGYDMPALRSAAAAALAQAAPGTPEAQRALALQAAALAWAGDPEAAAQADDALARLRPVLADVPSLAGAELWGHVATAEHARGRPAACVAALEQQRRCAREAGHVELEASALASLSGQQTTLGDSERAVEQARAAARLQRRAGALHTATLSEVNLLIALTGLNRLAEALQLADTLQAHMQATAANPELRLIVGDLRADLWLRLGDADAAMAELADEPPAAQPARVVNRLGLRALACGDEAAWQRLRAALPAQGQGGVRLRWQLLAARAPGAAARALPRALAEARAGATATGSVALAALAALLEAEAALDAHDHPAAQAAAAELHALQPRARHLYVDEARLRAVVCRVAAAGGRQGEAAAARQAALAWAEAQPLAGLAPALRERWCARADLAPLFSGRARAAAPAAPAPARRPAPSAASAARARR